MGSIFIEGRRGPVVGWKNNGKFFLRKYVRGSNPRTYQQQIIRSRFSLLNFIVFRMRADFLSHIWDASVSGAFPSSRFLKNNLNLKISNSWVSNITFSIGSLPYFFSEPTGIYYPSSGQFSLFWNTDTGLFPESNPRICVLFLNLMQGFFRGAFREVSFFYDTTFSYWDGVGVYSVPFEVDLSHFFVFAFVYYPFLSGSPFRSFSYPVSFSVIT